VREVLDKGIASEIKGRTEQLMQARMKVFEKVHKKKNEQGPAGGQGGSKEENKSDTT